VSGAAALRGSDTLGGVGFIGFGIVVIGVGVAVLLLSNVPLGVAIIGIGVLGIVFGIRVLAGSGSTGRTRARSGGPGQDSDGQDYDSQDYGSQGDADG
jgi:hypothetical protein